MQHRDPVCGMTVETDTAIRSAGATRTEYFCSTACRDRFEANPDQFIGRPAERGDRAMERHEPPYTSEGVTAPKFGSAGSGGAEYERVPEHHEKK